MNLNHLTRSCFSLLQISRPWCGCTNALISTSSRVESQGRWGMRRRWKTDEKWKKNRYTDKKWTPSVPMEHNIDPWRRDNAYFGTYDFMDILGNDATLHPDLLCKGPSYLRGKRLSELQMLIKRRTMYGERMHAEDLNQADKRIRYLIKRSNRVKKEQTRWHRDTVHEIIRE